MATGDIAAGNMSRSIRLSTSIASSHSRIFNIIPLHKHGIHISNCVSIPRPITATHSKVLISENLKIAAAEPVIPVVTGDIEVDRVTEAELKENGFRSTRRTKIVCTIGPRTCGFEELEALAVGGMNVARINMCHGTRAWHRAVIQRVRKLNEEKGFAVAVMMDTEGSMIHMGDLNGAESAKAEVSEDHAYLMLSIKWDFWISISLYS